MSCRKKVSFQGNLPQQVASTILLMQKTFFLVVLVLQQLIQQEYLNTCLSLMLE